MSAKQAGNLQAENLIRDLMTNSERYYNIEWDSAQTKKGLTKIPLISTNAFVSGPAYKLVTAVQSEGNLKIKETGVVSQLEIWNQSQYPMFVPVGVILTSQEHGWQDRTVTTDIMIPAEKKLTVPVACVEKHRWHARSVEEVNRVLGTRRIKDSDFAVSYFASPHVTGRLVGSVSRGLYGRAGRTNYRVGSVRSSVGVNEPLYTFAADQSSVWQSVDKEIQQAGADNPTKSLTEVHIKKQKDGHIEFDIYENEIGDIFVGNGKVLAMELYNKPGVWQAAVEDVVRRYKTAVHKEDGFSRKYVDKFLTDLRKCETKAVKSLGLGYDVRLVTGNVEGGSLVVDDSPIHFTAIPNSDGENYKSNTLDPRLRYPGRIDYRPTGRSSRERRGIDPKIMDELRRVVKAGCTGYGRPGSYIPNRSHRNLINDGFAIARF